jgi:type I restriction enzyme S subunit
MGRVETKFKETEIGLVPWDWEVKPLSKIGTFKKGKGIRKNEVQTDGIPCIRYGELYTHHNEYIKIIGSYISSEVAKKSQKIDNGDILFAGSGETKEEIGRCAAFIQDIEAYAGGDVVIMTPVNCNSLFLGFILNSSIASVQKAKSGQGDAVVHLYPRDIAKILIPIPKTKTEQTAIANALSDVDGYIESLEKLIAKKQKIKQGAMQQLLKPKPHWVMRSLGEIGEIIGAGVDKEIKENESPVRLVNYMDVFKRDFIYSNDLNHWVTAPQSKIQKYAVKQGDIFFTPSSEMRFDIAISAVAMENIQDAVHSYHLIKLRLFQDWDLKFRAYIFKTNYFLHQAEQICEGSGKRYVITLPKFRNLKIYYPANKDEQKKIAQTLTDIDSEITNLNQKLTKAKHLKQGMMQQLLTGKIRLL